MTVDDRRGHVDELVAAALGVVAQHREGLLCAGRVTCHEDPLRLLDHRPAVERALQVVVFGEAQQRDVDRALQLVGHGVDDVGEDPAVGRLADEGRILAP